MKKLPIVALIGQTNAGKSSLLNRFAHQNIAIVAREEGTTRDNVITRIDDRFLLIDTAGLKDPEDDFEAGIQDQIADAIDSADLILLTLDSSLYPDDKDRSIAKNALRSRKPVFLLLNKSDLGQSLPDAEFLRLGIKPDQTFRVSATTGQGIKELKNTILNKLAESFAGSGVKCSRPDGSEFSRKDQREGSRNFSDSPARGNFETSWRDKLTTETKDSSISQGRFSSGAEDNANIPKDKPAITQNPDIAGESKGSSISRDCFPDDAVPNHGPAGDSIRRASPNLENDDPRSQQTLKVALIGRPNVGKSSLFNGLGQKQQALVSSRQGTTRDVNRLELRYHGRTIEFLDTAGLRKPGKREVGIEKFSALRTLAAIEESDICALLVDATEPHSKLDQSLAGQIIDAGKGIIVVPTKADLIDDTDHILDQLEKDFNFLPYAPVLITSSATGQNLTKLFELALEIDATRRTKIRTSELNKILNEAIVEHPPAGLKNTRPKPKYIVQTDTCPPWFVVHGRDLGLLHWSWKRFLERKIREQYPFVGTPIFFSFRNNQDSRKESEDN